ncbi:MAG TPA: GerMN domain-containing protein [Firmicutes bacterium]|nr:GerMN domain-containing protein [Bacillota bacterium]
MKWEYRIAALLMALVLLLAARGLWSRYQAEKYVPTLVTWGEPFFPVYFASADGVHLEPEFRPGEANVEKMLQALVEGPRLPGLASVLPAGVNVLGYSMRAGVLYVSFSHHLRLNHPGGSRAESLTVYAIVNTLTEIAGIERVQILIENERSDTLTGHINLTEPLQRDYTILGSILI